MREAIAALIGIVLIVVGVCLIYVPAGVIVGGVGLIVTAYVARYLEVVQREDA